MGTPIRMAAPIRRKSAERLRLRTAARATLLKTRIAGLRLCQPEGNIFEGMVMSNAARTLKLRRYCAADCPARRLNSAPVESSRERAGRRDAPVDDQHSGRVNARLWKAARQVRGEHPRPGRAAPVQQACFGEQKRLPHTSRRLARPGPRFERSPSLPPPVFQEVGCSNPDRLCPSLESPARLATHGTCRYRSPGHRR